MTILTFDHAKFPDGGTATPAAGGSLAQNTTYYYRVAAVTAEGETCACASFNGTTTNVNLTLNLAWNAVYGVKATAGYQIYRNTSDSWTSGSLKLATSNTNSYSDTGAATTAGVPVTFTDNQCYVIDEEQKSTVAELAIPGQEGGAVHYLGSPPKRMPIEGIVVGTTAITQLGKLRDIRAGGVPVTVTVVFAGQTWISDYYFIASLTWRLAPGTEDTAGAETLRWSISLVEG